MSRMEYYDGGWSAVDPSIASSAGVAPGQVGGTSGDPIRTPTYNTVTNPSEVNATPASDAIGTLESGLQKFNLAMVVALAAIVYLAVK